MRPIRVLVGVAGLAVAAYGGRLLLDEDLADLVDAALWLAGGVVAHDLLLSVLVLAVVVTGARLLPAGWRGPAATAFIVLGSVTLLAIPVLGRFGAAADNPTLLDRPYWAGWAGIVALVLVGTAASAQVQRRRDRSARSGSGARARG